MGPLTSYPDKSKTEHAGVSPDPVRNQLPSTKRSDVFGEPHEGFELHPAEIVRPNAY